MEEDRAKRLIIEIGTYIFLGMLTIFLSLFAGFTLKGFSEAILTGVFSLNSYLGNYLLYGILIVLGIFVGIFFPINNKYFIKEGETPWTQDKPSWYRIFTVDWIWNPIQGFLWYAFKQQKSLKEIKWLRNITRVTLLSILFFGLLGIFQLVGLAPQFFGLPSQQFSEGSDIIFSSFVPAFAENGALLFETFILAGLLAFLVSKYAKKENRNLYFWMGTLILVPIICAFSWGSFHQIVYQNSATNYWATVVFAYISTLFTLLTGVFIFFFMGHFFNNLVLKLAQFVTVKQDLAVYLGIAWIILLFIYIFFEYVVKKKKKSAEQRLVE